MRKSFIASALAALFFAGPSLSLTLEERDVARFSEAAVNSLLEMSFAHLPQDLVGMDEFFADRTSYENYMSALEYSGLPRNVMDKFMIVSAKDISVRDVTRVDESSDLFLVTGSVTKHYQLSKGAQQERREFEMELVQKGDEYGVTRLLVH